MRLFVYVDNYVEKRLALKNRRVILLLIMNNTNITINEQEAKRVERIARNTLKILNMIRAGYTANDIVQKVGCNHSVASYYIRLLVDKK